MNFTIKQILHASFLVEDTTRSLAFYQDLLGLEVDLSRPELGYPGAWLKIGDQQIHLIQLPSPDSKHRPKHGGHDRHVALEVDTIEELKQVIDAAGIAYSVSKSRSNVLFVRDPDGNALEFIGIR